MQSRYEWIGYRSVCLLACLLLAFAAKAATTQYVDEDELALHSAPGSQQRVIQHLESGDELEQLASPEGGWMHVSTDDDEQGYVKSDALASADPADEADEAEHAGHKLDRHRALDKLDHDELLREYRKLESRLQDAQATSADARRLASENEQYRKELMNLQSEVASLKSDNQSLQVRRAGMRTGGWIMAGGVLLGFVLAEVWRLSGRRDPDTF